MNILVGGNQTIGCPDDIQMYELVLLIINLYFRVFSHLPMIQEQIRFNYQETLKTHFGFEPSFYQNSSK